MTTDRFDHVIQRIDAANREDPHTDHADGKPYPKEYLYSLRMTEELARFAPGADDVLQIAARAQHIRRWTIPRADYPQTRAGYLAWRRDLGRFHAEQTAALMRDAGYNDDDIERAKGLLTKKALKQNPDAQTLEDVICLVFLKHYLQPFAAQHAEDKLIAIIRKTWNKMSERGQQAATGLALPDALSRLLTKALGAS